MLAAIHTWAVARAPRIARLLPAFARVGEPVIIEGARLGGRDLRVCFGAVSTWAFSLSERAAVTVVPPGASAGPLVIYRQGLRSNGLAFGGPADEVPTFVVRVDPRDGATGVLRDTPVLARLSYPVDPGTLTPVTFRVDDGAGPVPGQIQFSPDEEVVIWQAARLLDPGVQHTLIVSGLRDRRGREVTPCLSRFLPCALARSDLGD